MRVAERMETLPVPVLQPGTAAGTREPASAQQQQQQQQSTRRRAGHCSRSARQVRDAGPRRPASRGCGRAQPVTAAGESASSSSSSAARRTDPSPRLKDRQNTIIVLFFFFFLIMVAVL